MKAQATANVDPSEVNEAAERRRIRLAGGAILGQVVFTLGWLVAGALEPDGYSSARHDSSDLASMTAHYAPLILVAQAIAGALTIAFAIGALRPAIAIAGQRSIGEWLVAGSLAGSELVTELFFRLDCRAVDVGCTPEVATESWHGKLHVIVGFLALFMTIAAPFVLARRMRLVAGWHDLASPAIAFGLLQIPLPILYGVFYSSPVTGYLNRAPLVLASVGLVALALRVRRQALKRLG
jgi:hypothetical protein